MTVREQLRGATHDMHEALHHAAPFARIADGKMDMAGYGALLQFLHRYHTLMAGPCEAAALALDAPALAQAHRARISALEQDMEFLGVAPWAAAAEASQGAAFAMGCLYTVQGSTLGGKVIFRQLDYLLAGPGGRRFFEGTSEDSANWRLLCRKLESQDGALDRIADGARHAFARFADLLASENPDPPPRSPAPGVLLIQSA